MGSIFGLTGGNIAVIGKVTVWTTLGFTSGTMVESTKDFIKTTRNMATENIFGLIRKVIKGGGTKVSNMVWEY